jgi:hypothetical protein
MELATQQRKLLALFRSSYTVSDKDEEYIQKVARSRDLAEGRKNIALWRIWVLERTCALTMNLLRRRGMLGGALDAFITNKNISPFRETQAPAFLESLSKHSDKLVACVAQFELALMKVKSGDERTYTIAWHLEPSSILHCLAKDIPLREEARGSYEVRLNRNLPGLFEITSKRKQRKRTADHSRMTL